MITAYLVVMLLFSIGGAWAEPEARSAIIVAICWPVVIVLAVVGLALVFALFFVGAAAEIYVWRRKRQ